MRIGYIANQYPKVSHSFIRREIFALERQGIEVVRFALREGDADIVDEDDLREKTRTHYVLQRGVASLVLGLVRVLVARPMPFLRALALACRMGWQADRPLPVHLIYLVEACALTRLLQQERIVHLHAHFGTNSAEVAMLVNVLCDLPWSFTAHGPEEFDKAALIGLKEKVRRATFVVAISSYGRSQLYRLAAHSLWSKIHVVRCGLEPEYFASSAPPPPATPRIVCVGRLCEQKGQLLLIEAVRQLTAEGIGIELVLAGDGEMRPDIDALLRKHDLLKQVRITGWISAGEVRREIVNARALVLPSFAEGLPVVIMEAMALGRPVISTFVAGIPELVDPGIHGWLVAAGDRDALVGALRDCLGTSPDTLAQMGEAAIVQVSLHHGVDEQAEKLAQLFRLATERKTSHEPEFSV